MPSSAASRGIAAAAVRGARSFSLRSALPPGARARSRCRGSAPSPPSFCPALVAPGNRHATAAAPADLPQPCGLHRAAESSAGACADNSATEDAAFLPNREVKVAGTSTNECGQGGEALVSSDSAAAESGDSTKPRFPKRSVAILLGYSGKGYRGMQVHKDGGCDTIEGELLRALTEIGSLTAANAGDPHKVSLRRASRTDKGVHAAENIVSIKTGIGIPGLVKKLNAALPPQIRAYGYSLAMKAFDPRRDVTSRKYEYLLPTYALEHSAKPEYRERSISWEESPLAILRLRYTATPEEIEEVNSYRLAPDKLEKARDLAKMLQGFRNFHNYTCGKFFTDRSAKRKMMTFTISDPFVRTTERGESTEWISLKLHGCSFMLHQIRKMIGNNTNDWITFFGIQIPLLALCDSLRSAFVWLFSLLIFVHRCIAMIIIGVRANADPSIMMRTFGEKHINIPKCPAYGLLLERPMLDHYNRVVEKQDRQTFEFEFYAEKVRQFKEEVIYNEIISSEAADHPWLGWLVATELHRETLIPYMLGELTSPALEALHIGPVDLTDCSAVDAAKLKLAGREAQGAFYAPYRNLGSTAREEIAEATAEEVRGAQLGL